MSKKWLQLSRILIILLTLSLVGCAGQTNQQQGTGIGVGVGAGVGAIIGQAIGGDTGATLLGAGIGATVGGIAGNQIGRYMDQQEQDLRNAVAASNAASVRRDQDVLTATFKGETFFDTNSFTIKPGGWAEVNRVATVLNKYPNTNIKVAGHTDSLGNEAYNQQLSERRARAVKNALIQYGVNGNRIRAIGYGESLPISSSNAQNRRVEIVITPNQA
ncbi:OmpA family protein [Desulfotalea psychrophila]|uniref:Probable outer membrane protein F n=1 Tax=Desulfotalea psychrophila (strain LSv54 / DSM 12343) TaxID=177439 RepID=Q6ARR8_DESPS|nr:OmpA family protein [Desulfotalea psychrophila]CAG34957.1 probable outer membrane protein F [Desulfotalea psychrophila LSv54]